MNNAATIIRERLFELQDEKYKVFHCRLMPSVEPDKVIGVRTPVMRQLVKEIKKTPLAEEFLQCLPHEYYDENNVHGALIAGGKDFDKCIEQLDAFLPYVDNWATCDLISPKIFKKHLDELLPHIERWLASDHAFTIRFGMKMLMEFYLDDAFSPKYPAMVSSVKSEEYYVNMMIAWYFATALAKQWDAVIPYFEEPARTGKPGTMDKWTHNKAIQKAIESNRITPEQKDYLRTLKVK